MDWRAGTAPETQILTRSSGLALRLARGEAPAGDLWDWIEPPHRRPAGSGRGSVGGAALVSLRGALWMPRAGLILDRSGTPMHASAGQVPARVRRLPAARASLPRAAVFMAGGARGNYGHFLFDALPGLHALDRLQVLAQIPAAAPPLRPWGREILQMAGLAARQITAPAVRVDHLVYVTTLNAYLNRAGPLVAQTARRLQTAEPEGSQAPVYLSRRAYVKRRLIAERRLEAALAAAGVRILRPERMSVRAQRAALSRCEALIGPSGAALANVMFLPRGARVIELRPDPVNEPWMELACTALGLEHKVVSGQVACLRDAPFVERAAIGLRRLAGRSAYAWEIEEADVLDALQAPEFTPRLSA